MRLDQVPGVTIKGFLIEFAIESKKYPELNRNFQLPVYTDIEDAIDLTCNVKRKTVEIVSVSDKLIHAKSKRDTYTLTFK